jgi:hypothetical protein
MVARTVDDVLGYHFMQSDQAIQATMHIANRIDTFARRQYRRGWEEFNHRH